MYVTEITEDKIDNLMEHMTRGLKCFNKAIECLESIKELHHSKYDDDDDEDDDYERYNHKSQERKNKGRYSHY